MSVLVICVFALQLPLDWTRYKSKPRSSIGALIEAIFDHHQNEVGEETPQPVRPIILADLHSYYPLVYYLNYDTRVSAKIKNRYPHVTPIPVFVNGALNRGDIDRVLRWPPPIPYIAPVYLKKTRWVLAKHRRGGPATLWLAISNRHVADKADTFFNHRGDIVKFRKRFGDSNLLFLIEKR